MDKNMLIKTLKYCCGSVPTCDGCPLSNVADCTTDLLIAAAIELVGFDELNSQNQDGEYYTKRQ